VNESFSKFLSSVVTAVSQCSLYSKEHPAVAELCEKAVNFLQELFIDDSINITHLGGNLVFNDMPLTEKGVHVENIMKRMKTKGIDKIILKKGVSTDELMSFISQMASKDEAPKSSEHILVGTIQVRLTASGDDTSEIMRTNISRVQGVYQEVSRFKRLDTVGLEDAVLGFLSAIKKEANILRLVSPVKSYSEYTYIHTSNVAVLTLFQAESLGLTGESLREAGLAGLLHDVGKLFVSKDVLEKQAKLDDIEWKEMKKHPVYGAMYLCSLEDPPRLAVIAAYEHHLKFDGSGYPDTKKYARKQHIISQIVALSDFFDALRSERPYRKAFELNALIDLIKKGAGKDFNPLIIDNFITSLQKTGVLPS
jgi:HD-GYP domain-containing protein (c-di-GMP phosphodiesterase class II)